MPPGLDRVRGRDFVRGPADRRQVIVLLPTLVGHVQLQLGSVKANNSLHSARIVSDHP